MTILLSQLFSPATLVATVLPPASQTPAPPVRARPPHLGAGLSSPGSRFFETVFGLKPMPEERPYAL